MNKEWRKTGYDDLIKKYKVGKSHLYEILTDDPNEMAKNLKKGIHVIMDFRNRHDLMVSIGVWGKQ